MYYIDLDGAAARGLEVMVSLRLKDELVAEIDRAAQANGQSRSAWMTSVLTRAVLAPEHDELPTPAVGRAGHPDDQIRITVRLSRSEVEAIEEVASTMRLSRNAWIKRSLRWQLWDKAAQLRLSTVTKDELGKARKQVLHIGKNINQAVHAMNAANQPGSSLDLARIAGPFLETCTDLKGALHVMRRALSRYVGGEVSYWTGAFGEPRG